MKPCWRHAHDGEGRAVERQRLAHDVRVAAEASLPESVAEHDDRHGLVVFFRQERTAHRGLSAEDREIVAAHHLHGNLLGLGAGAPVHLGEGEARHLREHLVLVAQILVVEVRERQIAGIALVGHEDRGQPIRFVHGNRLEQRRVHEAEDRGVGADAERQREHGDGREARALGQHAQAVAQILKHGPGGP